MVTPEDFKNVPAGGLDAGVADGLYLEKTTDGIVIYSVGPRKETPGELEYLFPGMIIAGISAMAGSENTHPEIRRVIFRRGFLAIKLVPVAIGADVPGGQT